MLLVAQFSDEDADILDVAQHVIDDIENCQLQFFKWLFDKSINHSYWVIENGRKKGCCYRGEAFVEWLNEYQTERNSNAKVVKSYVKNIDADLPVIYF